MFFMSLVDIGCILVIVYFVSESELLSLFVNKINIPPQKRHDRPRRTPVDKEVALVPQSCLEACLVYANFWYVQA